MSCKKNLDKITFLTGIKGTQIKFPPNPPPWSKNKPRRGANKPRLTLWHEGINKSFQSDPEICKEYVKQMVDFVIDKGIDKVFLQLQDPSAQKDDKKTFAYSQKDFIVENFLKPLEGKNIITGLLIAINPKYPWNYQPKLTGGLMYNNPGYKTITKNIPPCFECVDSKGNVKKIDNQTECTEKKFSWKIQCDNKVCPNNLEQAFYFIDEVNQLAKNNHISQLIETVAMDGEGMGCYQDDEYGMAQAWQASSYALDVKEIGFAKQSSLTAKDVKSNAAYPEFYWINELQYSPESKPCKMCKTWEDTICQNSSENCTYCNNCKTKIYQQYQNNVNCMYNAWKPYLGDKTSPNKQGCNLPFPTTNPIKSAQINIKNIQNSPGTCPLISIEHAHFSPSGDGELNNCIQRYPYLDKTKVDPTGFCGTFDGFGSWDWDKFLEFLDLLHEKYEFKELGIYEWQFVPNKWLKKSSSSNNQNNQKSSSSSIIIPIIIIGIIILGCILLYLLLIRRKKEYKKLKK